MSLYITEIENSFDMRGKKEQEQLFIVPPLRVRMNQKHTFTDLFPS